MPGAAIERQALAQQLVGTRQITGKAPLASNRSQLLHVALVACQPCPFAGIVEMGV